LNTRGDCTRCNKSSKKIKRVAVVGGRRNSEIVGGIIGGIVRHTINPGYKQGRRHRWERNRQKPPN